MDWTLLGWLAVLLYVAAEGASIAALVRPRRFPWTRVLLVAGLVLQFVDLHMRARALGSVPYRTLAGSMSLFGWMLGVAYLALIFRHRERAVGPFLIPFVILFSVVSLLVPFAPSTPSPETRGALFALHVTIA